MTMLEEQNGSVNGHAPAINGRLKHLLGDTSPVTPVVPDDAPFNEGQRHWLNGLMTGLTVLARAATSRGNGSIASPAAAAPAVPVTILYGSQSGNCEALSKDLRKLATASGFAPSVRELNDVDPRELASLGRVLMVCSTFGEGDPPDNAKKFFAKMHADEAPSLAGLSYSVCGLGDSSYTFFNKAARDLDARMAKLGASRLAEFMSCDVAYEDDYAAWKQSVFASPVMTEAVGRLPAASPTVADETPLAKGWDKHNPYFAPVHAVERLSAEGSAKEVNHVEILLSGSGLEYEVGDALGIWPVNDPALVEEILVVTGITGTQRVLLKGQQFPIRLALQTKLDVVTLTQATLDALRIDASIEKVRGLHLIDAMRKWEPKVSPQGLADALRPLQPRLYSIASSPKAHPGEVHLTVGAVRYQLDGIARKGVASTYLADRCGFGQRVGVYVHKAPHFHLTAGDEAPVIMCGPGTGIAPFRAFLEERQARGAKGKNWLFFGDQHEATDFLYRDQLGELQESGTLTKLSLAWSRDGKEKVYVQSRMMEEAQELFAWLEQGAYFYICGDASRMAGDVDATLRRIIAAQGKLDDQGVQDYMDTLVKQHRYQRDVY